MIGPLPPTIVCGAAKSNTVYLMELVDLGAEKSNGVLKYYWYRSSFKGTGIDPEIVISPSANYKAHFVALMNSEFRVQSHFFPLCLNGSCHCLIKSYSPLRCWISFSV